MGAIGAFLKLSIITILIFRMGMLLIFLYKKSTKKTALRLNVFIRNIANFQVKRSILEIKLEMLYLHILWEY